MTSIRSGTRRRGTGILALAATAAMLVSGAVGAGLSSTTAQAAPPPEGVVNIVDTHASPETRSLWSYLNDTRGQGILFGHQHDIDNGLTFSEPNGTNSDIHAGTGDYPAVFGWDTLILEGLEGPGKATNTDSQNVTAFADGLKQAHRLGGISTISAHMRNFVTGENFNDNRGRVVSHILPGGDKNAEFNEYLDLIADTAKAAVDDNGKLIPIVFRPFHENTGSWFWWGSSQTTPGEYKELFRYTVEYLRDTQGVSNFLYAFSPNGNFGGDAERYLATYPGDQWVDVMGYDAYENSNEPDNSDTWINNAVTDLAMLSDLADEHGKIATFTEFGRNGDRTIKPTGNKSLTFYTDLLKAIKANPKAKRMAYMLTWSDWGQNEFYIPYPAYGNVPEHEMYQDFLAFYNDPYTVFASNIPADALTREAEAAPAQATLRLVSPADGVRVTEAQTTVRAKTTVDVPTKVWFTVGDDATEHALSLDAEGYYSALWNIAAADLSNKTVSITVHATYTAGDARDVTSSIVLGAAPELPVGVIDDFEGYGDDAALQAAFAFNNVPATSLTLGVGESASKGAIFSYDFSARDYQGFGKVLTGGGQDWSAFTRMNMWLDPDGSNQKLVLQMKAGGKTFEAYPSLAGTQSTDVSISFSDFRPPPWDTQNADVRVTPELLKSVTEFYVFMNKTDSYSTPGSIGLDNLRAVVDGPTPSPTPSATATATSGPTATATTTVTVTPRPPSGGDVYTTPGYHSVNGRKWFTTCESYSMTWRCTTEIWATQVTNAGGKFVKATGWFFNNLTYLPSARAAWAKNPLGHTGEWTSSEGRQWRTECDTAATGRNGCRSYIWATVVESTRASSGTWRYAMVNKWVFNNIVLFA
ncbi:glycosyl hydrolase [Tessaracoccus antarcticus]|nr:glycosyl hydrolase [Tessaracoccus antarcticus]